MTDMPAPAPVPTSPTDTIDNLLEGFSLSKQAEQVIELISSNNLNKQAGYGIDTLTENMKRFEHGLGGQRLPSEIKTAGLMGVVEQTAHAHAFADIDISEPANKNKVDSVGREFKAVLKQVYDNPVANPLHRDLGGFYDIDKAKQSLSMGRRSNPRTFAPNILVKNQQLVVEAVSAMPDHLQQLAMQGVKQAALDASKSNNHAGQKTDTVHYVKSSVESTLRSYDTANRTIGYQEIAGGQEQAFDRAMYDAKGARQHVAAKGDRTLASNKPPAQITTKSQDSYTNMMIDGLNAQTQKLHEQYGKPHTFNGDIELNHRALNMLDNVNTLSEYLDERVADDNRDRSEGRELNELHKQTKGLVDNVLELSKELPFRDLELSRTAERTKQDLESKNPSFQRAEQETVYKEAQEAANTTVRSIPRSLAMRNP